MTRRPKSPSRRAPAPAELRRASWRLGAQAAALLLATLALFAVIVVVIVAHEQQQQTTTVLDEAIGAAHGAGGAGGTGGTGDRRPDGDDAQIRAVSVAVHDEGGFQVDGTMPAGLPDRSVMAAVARSHATDQRTVVLRGRHYAVRTVQKGDDTVQAVLDLSEEREELTRLMQAMLIAGLAGILVVGAASAWLGGRVVRPLVDALAMQRRFVSDAAHELRTPLTLLSTRAQLVARRLRRHPGGDDTGPAGAAVAADLDGLVLDAANLTAILEELLLAADVRAAPVEEIDLGELLGAVVAAAEAHAEQAGVAVRVTGAEGVPVRVLASRTPLSRAVTALLDNAVDHARTSVELELRPARHGRRPAERTGPQLVVTDDGPGIRPDRLAGLFERFSSDRTGEGTGRRHYGLGLSLVSEVVTRFGGTVTADNGPGGGAVFTVTLPDASRPPRRTRADVSLRGPREVSPRPAGPRASGRANS